MATKKTGNSNGKKGGVKKMSTATKVEIGAAAALAVAAAAGAGYYFYGDKNAKKHRQAASKWAKGMKQDVVQEAQKVKKLDQKAIARIVDSAAAAYQGARSVDPKDLRQATAELKKHWRDIQSEIGAARGSAKKATGSAKKVAKTAKKTANKSAGSAKKAAKKKA